MVLVVLVLVLVLVLATLLQPTQNVVLWATVTPEKEMAKATPATLEAAHGW